MGQKVTSSSILPQELGCKSDGLLSWSLHVGVTVSRFPRKLKNSEAARINGRIRCGVTHNAKPR